MVNSTKTEDLFWVNFRRVNPDNYYSIIVDIIAIPSTGTSQAKWLAIIGIIFSSRNSIPEQHPDTQPEAANDERYLESIAQSIINGVDTQKPIYLFHSAGKGKARLADCGYR